MSRQNPCSGISPPPAATTSADCPLPPPLLRERKAGKVRYVQYTDATFTAQVIAQRSLGILGPVLRGVVGEFLAVTFLNRTDQPLSMHPHGLKYDKDSEGAHYFPNPGRGAAVGPRGLVTRMCGTSTRRPVPDRASPVPRAGSITAMSRGTPRPTSAWSVPSS